MLLRNRHTLWLRLVLALGAMGILVLGYQWGNEYQRSREEPAAIQGVLVRPAGTIPDFSLRDPLGRTFDQRRLEGLWTLMAFGDLAQASGQRGIQRMVDAYNRVADQQALRQSLQLVLITDPESPALARDFARLSPALHILGGGQEDIARMRAAVGLTDEDAPTLFLFAPGAKLIAVLPADETGQDVAEDLKTFFADPNALTPEQP